MADQQPRLTDVLDRFDTSQDGFHYYDVSGALRELEAAVRTAGETLGPEIVAELIVFDLVANYSDQATGWGTYYVPMVVTGGREYPGLACITPAVVDHWIARARAARHPLLRVRYADAAWDLWRKAGAAACSPDIPRVMIDGAVEATGRGQSPDDVDTIRQLERALTVAIALRDDTRIGGVRDAILACEDRIGVDHLPGLWGFSFDLLLMGGRKVPMTDEQTRKIVSDIEGRLTRLTAESDVIKLNPHHVEGAALRLARYYRKRQQDADVRRVLGCYAGAYLRKAEGAAALVASAWLQKVHDTLLGFNLREEAEAVLLHYRNAARRVGGELKPITASVSIDRADVEAYLSGITAGEWDDVFCRVTDQFLPRREDERRRLEDMLKGDILLGLFGQTLLDHDGRAVAGIGSLEDDPEGNLIHHVGRGLGFAAFFLRAVVERLISARGLTVEHITAFAYQSPALDPAKRQIVEAGLRAYLAGDWLVAIHLLVPQIEDTVRRLVGLTGGQTMKKGRNDGLLLRTLDELLRDERAERVLGSDAAFYLRILLTDQRGWNLRNDVAHGITPVEQFAVGSADRLVHALLILGKLRARPAGGSDASAEGPLDPDPAEPASPASGG